MNIGFACSLLRTDMALYRVSAETPEVTRLEHAGRPDEVCGASCVNILCWSQTLCMDTLWFGRPACPLAHCACIQLLPALRGRGGHKHSKSTGHTTAMCAVAYLTAGDLCSRAGCMLARSWRSVVAAGRCAVS